MLIRSILSTEYWILFPFGLDDDPVHKSLPLAFDDNGGGVDDGDDDNGDDDDDDRVVIDIGWYSRGDKLHPDLEMELAFIKGEEIEDCCL